MYRATRRLRVQMGVKGERTAQTKPQLDGEGIFSAAVYYRGMPGSKTKSITWSGGWGGGSA